MSLRLPLMLGAALAVVALGIAIGLTLGSGDADDEATLGGEGFELSYPTAWTSQQVDFPLARAAGADYVDDTVVGRDRISYIAAYSFERPGSTPVSEANVMAFAPALRDHFEEAAAGMPAPGRVVGSPEPLLVSGLPALRLALEYRHSSGFEVRYDATQVFGSERIYIVACHYPPPREAEVSAACDRALETFRQAR